MNKILSSLLALLTVLAVTVSFAACSEGDPGMQGEQGPAGVSVGKIEKTATEGLTDTYTVTFTDGSTTTFTVQNGNGITAVEKTASEGLTDTYTVTCKNGITATFTVQRGIGIATIERTTTEGLTDTYTVTFTNGETTTFTVQNGNSIAAVEKTATEGLTDTYTITFSNGKTSTFTVQGGSSISSLEKTATEGLTDTYTITFTNGGSALFTVQNGSSIASMEKTATVGLTDTYTVAFTNGATATFTVQNGDKGDRGDDGNTILKTEIIDGCLWITYSNDPEHPVNAGVVFEAHDFSDWITPAGAEGIQRRFCKICGHTESRWYCNGRHTPGDVFVDVSATCTQEGKRHTVCAACGDIYKKETLPMLDHVFEDKICTVCGTEDGLAFTLSDDGTYYILTSMGTCTDTVVTVPSTYHGLPVREIANQCFAKQADITEIHLPDSITAIGARAFSACMSLTEIRIPASVEDIGANVFEYCLSLHTVYYDAMYGPDWDQPFLNIPSIQRVVFGGEMIPDLILMYCSNVRDVEILPTVKRIGSYAFESCSGLTSITIPDSVTYIGDYAFQNCTHLRELTLSRSVTRISNGMLALCHALREITLHEGITEIHYDAFFQCDSLTDVTVPEGVESIYSMAFYSCDRLSNLYLPSSLQYVGDELVEDANSLTGIVFGGTQEAWNELLMYSNNPALYDVQISFLDRIRVHLPFQYFDELRIFQDGVQTGDVFTPGTYYAWDGVADLRGLDADTLQYWGWISTTEDTLGTFGYRIGGNAPVLNDAFAVEPEDAASSMAAPNLASRLQVDIDLSLYTGEQTVTVLYKDTMDVIHPLSTFTVILPDASDAG